MSFSIDLSSMMQIAASFVTAFGPIIGIVAGLSLAFGVVAFIISRVSNIFSKRG